MKIKPFQNPSGATVWRVVGTVNGKHIRENHRTEVEALQAKQNYEREAANLPALPAITTRLTSGQVAEAEAAFHRLTGQPLTLSQVVDFALANYQPASKAVTVADAFKEFMAAKRQTNLRPDTLRNLNQRLTHLVTTCGACIVSELQAEIIRPLVYRVGCGPVSHSNYYRGLSGFFNWCKVQGYLTASPLDKIEAPSIERDEPVILTPEKIRSLCAAMVGHKEGVLTPYIVLGMFCAIRPTELARLTWDDIDLETGTVTIGAKLAKMRARRIVAISPNAVAFLLPHAIRKTPLAGVNWRRDFTRVKRNAGIAEWTPDVLRHTGISYHLAEHKHEGQTAAWAGNSPDVIQQHYKGLVKAKDSADFWAITPQSLDNITTLETKAA